MTADTWRDNAACLPHVMAGGTDYWHEPDNHGSGIYETPQERAWRESMAKTICTACPVRVACLQDAYDNDEHDGIRGGRLPSERRPSDWLACKEARGSMKGYQRHRRAREPVCPECMTAKGDYKADRKRAVA